MQRMNLQQGRPFANGYSGRRVDTVMGTRTESKTQGRKSASPNFVSTNGTRVGRPASPSRDRLIYVLTCLVGHHVEVHVKNGSIISGIFHATNADEDFEIVLKMAQVIKDGSVKERKSDHDSIKKPQPMVIPARELVQVLAKDVSLGDEFTPGQSCENQKDLMIDSVISHSHHLETERELAPWMPDEDDPECPELENIFDGTFDRKWDQFETNEALFGVKSTFNEELYTTKLERGPQMRDLEKLALKIAREIEGEETQDLHLAEERGFSYHDDFDLDEESRYSAVRREVIGSGLRENENSDMEAYGSGIFAGSLGLVTSGSCSDSLSKKNGNETQASSTSSSVVEEPFLHTLADKDLGLSSVDANSELKSDCIAQSSSLDDEIRLDDNQIKDQGGKSGRMAIQDSQTSDDVNMSIKLEEVIISAPLYDPSSSSQGNIITESSDSPVRGKLPAASESVDPPIRQVSSTSYSEYAHAELNRPFSSPSTSCGSLSSEKSTLNPNAKEFKLNPNAKSFTPSSSVRLHAAVPDGSFYQASNVNAVQHMHGLPLGVGLSSYMKQGFQFRSKIHPSSWTDQYGSRYAGHGPKRPGRGSDGSAYHGGSDGEQREEKTVALMGGVDTEVAPSFSHQPVFYNPQAAQIQSPQAYIHPNGPVYGQQMIVGQHPQFYYVQSYPPEMPHKGRKF